MPFTLPPHCPRCRRFYPTYLLPGVRCLICPHCGLFLR